MFRTGAVEEANRSARRQGGGHGQGADPPLPQVAQGAGKEAEATGKGDELSQFGPDMLTATDLLVGVLLPSATDSSGMSTFASGK